ncbi:MAG: hypothetical protein ABSA83_15940 [Verrucomicrobiota bacterium]|jgi:hypothetical protein
MQSVSYGGWPRCIRLANQDIELIATTDVGPRIIRLGFVGGPNLFKEFAEVGQTGGEAWRNYGGHRLWHAPEAMPRTYAPDNSPIQHQWDGAALQLNQPTELATGIQKQIEVKLDPQSNSVTVRHRLANRNPWAVELAPWALSVMQGPGRAILPQEPPANDLLPVRPAAFWGYTDMADPRWTWGSKYIQLASDPAATTPQKFGVGNKLGWAAYFRDGQVFIKRFPFDPAMTYPDFGCNLECYTNGDMLEVESVGPLTKLAPNATVDHVERWFLGKAKIGESDHEIEQAMAPLLRQFP